MRYTIKSLKELEREFRLRELARQRVNPNGTFYDSANFIEFLKEKNGK